VAWWSVDVKTATGGASAALGRTWDGTNRRKSTGNKSGGAVDGRSAAWIVECGEARSPIRSSISQDQKPINMDPPDAKYAIHQAAREGSSMLKIPSADTTSSH
jgi:hypothetical protein